VAVSTTQKVQLCVRVDPQIANLIDDQVAKAKNAGHRITKEKLVSDAITAVYQDSDGGVDLPVHRAIYTSEVDPSSTTALLDFVDRSESLGA